MKKISKYILSFAVLSFLVLPMFTTPVAQAQTVDLEEYGVTSDFESALGDTLGSVNKDPRVLAADLIKTALGFLAIIAVVIVLFGGFKWMTAAGNDDKIDDAKKILSAGVIGLIIILVAWGLTTWLIDTIAGVVRD